MNSTGDGVSATGTGWAHPGPGPAGGRNLTNRARPPLRWYADVPARRVRQVVGDLVVAAWCTVWLAVGLAVHAAVSALVGPTRSLAAGAGATADQLEAGGAGVSRLPLVGDSAAAPFQAAAESVDRIAGSTADLADQVAALALLVGVLVPLAPVSIVLLLWLPARLRGARLAGAAHDLLARGADPDLFALRALATQPVSRLAAVSADPVGDWRRGDADVTRALARLELDRLGVRAP